MKKKKLLPLPELPVREEVDLDDPKIIKLLKQVVEQVEQIPLAVAELADAGGLGTED